MTAFAPNAALAAAGQAAGARLDPFLGFNFHVEVESLVVGAFSEVSGLESEVGVKTYSEGGANDWVHTFPEPLRHGNLILKRGLTFVDGLWRWHQDVVAGKIERRNLTVYLLDARQIPVTWWDVHGAWPVKWRGPELAAGSGAVAFEAVELAYGALGKSASATAAGRVSGAAGLLGKETPR